MISMGTVRTVTVIVVVALVLSGCGDSGDSGDQLDTSEPWDLVWFSDSMGGASPRPGPTGSRRLWVSKCGCATTP